jgi:hypothetical protein
VMTAATWQAAAQIQYMCRDWSLTAQPITAAAAVSRATAGKLRFAFVLPRCMT